MNARGANARGAAPPHLLHVFSTFAAAGPQVRTASLINALGSTFRHSILALDGRCEARELVDPRLGVAILDAPPRAGTPRTVLRLARIFAREQPDVVLTYNFGALDAVIANKLGRAAPSIHHEDGFNPDEVRALKPRRVWLRRLILPGAHAIVVISRNLERIALERFRLPSDRVRYIANGIAVERFARSARNDALRAELGFARETCVVGAVGHLRAEKNVGRLLEAVELASQRADLALLVVGDGPLRAELEARASKPALASRVRFVGYHKDPRDLYRAMDAFALSSDTEQMPIALLEAMASSLPVVATDVGDVAPILPAEQRRFVVPADSTAAGSLANAILALAASAELRARLGQQNRAEVEQRFTFERMCAAYRDLYVSALRA